MRIGRLTISIENFYATDIGAKGVEAGFRSASPLVVACRGGGYMIEGKDDVDHENCKRHSSSVKML